MSLESWLRNGVWLRTLVQSIVDWGVVCVLSHVQLFVTPWTVAHQAPLSMGFFRQECWSGLPFPTPGDRPGPGIKPSSPVSPALQVDSLPSEPLGVCLENLSALLSDLSRNCEAGV